MKRLWKNLNETEQTVIMATGLLIVAIAFYGLIILGTVYLFIKII